MSHELSQDMSLRERWFPLIWGLLYPVRKYLSRFPFPRGKGFILRNVVIPLLPPRGAEYALHVPQEGIVQVGYRETLGLSSLLYGTFEKAELEFVGRYVSEGESVLDIGANIGLFSVVMGRAVGERGTVIAFDPVPSNIMRLRNNLVANGIGTGAIYELALGASNGQIRLKMSDDSAYASIREVEKGFGNGRVIQVEVRRLDDIWQERGRPPISFIKMDVEGAELDVIRGGAELLADCRPTLLVEANTARDLANLTEALRPYGYRHIHPAGFLPYNHLFVCPPHR